MGKTRRRHNIKNKTRSIRQTTDTESGFINLLFKRIENNTICKPQVLSRDPWLMVFDDFLSKEEVASILEIDSLIGGNNFIDSTVLNSENNQSEKSNYRTSSTFWCLGSCKDQPIIVKMRERVANLTGFSCDNQEAPQMLRYFPGQEYKVHSDYIDNQRFSSCGPRVLTLFVYLNDVEDGGETNFPHLNLLVKPKAGTAVLWPSVKNDFVMDRDLRTEHAAKPVIQGVKYGINIWIHLFSFKG